MSPYSQSLILKHDGEHFKGNVYDSKCKCTVVVYNLFQSLFLQLLTNKVHSYDFKCGILIKIWFIPAYSSLKMQLKHLYDIFLTSVPHYKPNLIPGNGKY
jgi:hypothetical protein